MNPKEILTSSPASPRPESSGWQPIETAPKDGTSVLLATRSHSDGVVIASVCETLHTWWDHAGEEIVDASAWMPLPESPTQNTEAQRPSGSEVALERPVGRENSNG